MNRENLPDVAFVDPTDANQVQSRQLAQQVVDLLLDFLGRANQRPLLPLTTPDLTGLANIPETALAEAVLLEQLEMLLNASMNPAHPGYIGHMDTMPTLISGLGDLVASLINNNMLSLEMSPGFSQLESQLLRQFAARFGLGPNSGGVLLSGGSLANLQALAVARNRAFGTLKKGLVGLDKPPVLFASAVAHTSLQKAAMLLGLGTEAVIPVPVNAKSQMDVTALAQKVEEALATGFAPFCVVATVGTTTTGNIDPLPGIADVAQRYGLWLHVDAAYGGALVLSEQERYRLNGIERADSITFNPQKWLYVAKTCAMALFADLSHLETAFRVSAPYMADAGDFTNLGEISVQGTRHADILKLWLSLQHIGRQGYQSLINESYRLTAYLAAQIAKRPYLELVSQPETNLLCFRLNLPGLTPAQLDHHNTDLQAYLLRTGQTFLSLPTYRGRRWLRAVLLNPYTDLPQLDNLLQHLDTFSKEL